MKFEELKPAEKKAYVKALLKQCDEMKRLGQSESPRNGQCGGYAFLWVSLYGKDALSKALRREIKATNKLFSNYRGSKHAWYFGSQSNLGIYDGLKKMTEHLNKMDIPCFLCDEYD